MVPPNLSSQRQVQCESVAHLCDLQALEQLVCGGHLVHQQAERVLQP